ncbi:hypothetical protein BDW22DRAFT_1488275 [Trametopsis cervina]|nr:hypothetical protein BDW22DRAFT_1488275 [Trametopsis cervina]
MARWTHFDSDSYRLPTGMERISYNSSTRTYMFRDSQGAVWEGTPGEEYGGRMTRVSGPTRPNEPDNGSIHLMPNSPSPIPSSALPPTPPSTSSSFHEFLPSSMITTASPPSYLSPSRKIPPVRAPSSAQTSSLRRMLSIFRRTPAANKNSFARVVDEVSAKAHVQNTHSAHPYRRLVPPPSSSQHARSSTV